MYIKNTNILQMLVVLLFVADLEKLYEQEAIALVLKIHFLEPFRLFE